MEMIAKYYIHTAVSLDMLVKDATCAVVRAVGHPNAAHWYTQSPQAQAYFCPQWLVSLLRNYSATMNCYHVRSCAQGEGRPGGTLTLGNPAPWPPMIVNPVAGLGRDSVCGMYCLMARWSVSSWRCFVAFGYSLMCCPGMTCSTILNW